MTATTAGIADTTEPLARQFVHRPLSDEFFAEALDDISRSYRDLPILDNDAVPLWEELGAWVRATAAQLRREYQITVYDDLDPYETAEQMHADIARGVYKVTSLHSNHPVWDKDTNVAFRITHDITGHGLTRSDFSFKGEVAAYRNQCLSTPEHLWPVLFTEVVAQSAYANVHHLFGEQKVALVPLTQDEIDAHVGQIMDAPDPGYDPLHVSASDHSSQRAWYTVADSIRARQHKAAAVGAKPVLHLLADDDDAALLNLLMHHADDLEASAGVVDVEFGRLGLEEIRRSHGFTVHDHFGDSPRSGYMVSISPATEKVIPLASVTAQDIADYRNAHKDLLADPDNYFGAWVWEGNVYLDISRNVRDRDEALVLGRRYNQLGIYDLARGETIEVPVAVAARRVFAMRACENCGARMSPFLPRRRLPDGSLVCKGCEKRHHEAALATLEGEEHPDQHIAATEGHTPSCEACGKPATWEVRGPLDTDEAYFTCDDHRADAERQFPGRAPEVSKVGTRKVAHDSGDGETVFHCLSGETRYVTRDGIKSLAETAGTVQQVLTAGPGSREGRWVEAMIHSFGKQPLRKVTLRRNKREKVVHATPEHRWPTRYGLKETDALRKGDRLPAVLPPSLLDGLEPSHEGICHGVVYGDGTAVKKWSYVNLWGEKDKQLLAYFAEREGFRPSPVETVGGVHGIRVAARMPASFKAVPDTDNPEYLYGWMAGYFAADGNVTKQGQVVLDSASLESLEAVKGIALRLGIATYEISSRVRKGFGKVRPIHRIEFVGSTLREDFFLIEEHRDRYRFRKASYERLGWTVVSVEETDRVDEVFCPRVPGTETFVLEGWLHTANCPFCGAGAVLGRSDGTIECQFCKTAFTVQVQPVRSSVPQTIDGVPHVHPDMPGGPTSEEPGQAPEDPGAQVLDKTTVTPADEDQKVYAARVEPYYLAADGMPMAEGSYLKHIALRYADDPGAVLASLVPKEDR